jgi:hypothetical protein
VADGAGFGPLLITDETDKTSTLRTRIILHCASIPVAKNVLHKDFHVKAFSVLHAISTI